jgi:uncharacterized protein (TIGR04255 family)
MRYPSNSLRQVICRMDFPALLGFTDSLPSGLKSTLRSVLPVAEMKPVRFGNLAVTVGIQTQVESDMQEGVQWTFHSSDRTRRLTIGPTFMTLEFDEYLDFPDFQNVLVQAIKALSGSVPAIEANRLGLRFINEIELPNGNPLNWSGYINARLVKLQSAIPASASARRTLGLVEFANDDIRFRFQFGMPNPDYPAPIRRRLFVLDYDAYVESGVAFDRWPEEADRLNRVIYDVFEDSIGDRLRKAMLRSPTKAS